MAIIYLQERINLIMINFVHFLLLTKTSHSLFLVFSSSLSFFLLGSAVIRVFSSAAQEGRCLK